MAKAGDRKGERAKRIEFGNEEKERGWSWDLAKKLD